MRVELIHHLKVPSCSNFPVIQYADDTIFFMPDVESQLHDVEDLMLHFVSQTWLRINRSKSILDPINITEDQFIKLLNIMGWLRGSFPFIYLGLPLNAYKPKFEDFTPIDQRI